MWTVERYTVKRELVEQGISILKDESPTFCQTCGSDIDTVTSSCPQCQRQLQKPGFLSRFFFAICHPFVAIVLALGIIGLGVVLMFRLSLSSL